MKSEQKRGVVHGAIRRWRTDSGGWRMDVHPGGFYFGPANKTVHTLLGSCISIVLTHRDRRFSGLCHFVLANAPDASPVNRPNARYAPDAMRLFDRACRLYGLRLSDCQARVFGGGNLLMNQRRHRGLASSEPVGDRNAARAFELLMEYRIPIQMADVGEMVYRKLVFDQCTDDVWIKMVPTGTDAMSRRRMTRTEDRDTAVEFF